MRKKSAQHSNAWGFALFIGALIGLLICVALIIKVVLLFSHSSFDGKHQFSLEIQEPGGARFVVFNPEDNSLHTVFINGFVSHPQLSLGIPVDGIVQAPYDISSFSTLANALLFDRKSLHVSTTIVDGMHFFVFIHTADTEKTITSQTSLVADPVSQDALLTKIFTDETVYKEGESIALINGTGISGLGSKIARLLNHMGGNVVSVTTSDTPSPMSSISYTGALSYTPQRLAHVLGLPLVHLATVGISDITVTLGTDRIQRFQ